MKRSMSMVEGERPDAASGSIGAAPSTEAPSTELALPEKMECDTDLGANVPRVRRVACGLAWVVHGFCLELSDLSRVGRFLENNENKPDMDLTDDYGLERRNAFWEDLEADEHITAVRGSNSKDLGQGYLAAKVEVVTNKRTIEFAGKKMSKYGRAFEWKADAGYEIANVFFLRGMCTGIWMQSQRGYAPVGKLLGYNFNRSASDPSSIPWAS
jgi:hypothetical protein